jgi:hypothetical protein
VPFDRAGAEEQLCTDLGVGATFGGEPRDLRLLRGQFLEGLSGGLAHAVTGGGQLMSGALGKCLHPHGAQLLERRAQVVARVVRALLLPEPLAVNEVGTGELWP